MQKHLADIYEAVFALFTEAMRWYTASSTSRFRTSFSDALPKRVDETVANIRRHISEMHRDMDLASAAEVRDARLTVEEVQQRLILLQAGQNDLADRIEGRIGDRIEELVVESRRSAFFNQSVGLLAVRLLLSMTQPVPASTADGRFESISASIAAPPERSGIVDDSTLQHEKEAALQWLSKFKSQMTGSNGLALLTETHTRFAEPAAIERLKSWFASTEKSSTLWITSEYEPYSTCDSTRAIAFGALAAAFGANAPFVSHFCELSHEGSLAGGATTEELGLLWLVYDLILQLIEFRTGDGKVDLSLPRLQQLDGTMTSWTPALWLLEDLLHDAKFVPYCILDNLAVLDYRTAKKLFSELLDVLLKRQQEELPAFNILLTTNGQSETLFQKISFGNTVYLKHNSRRVKNTGQLLELQIPHDVREVDIS